MVTPLERLEGRKFCVVFVKVIDESAGKVQLQCLRGRANVERGRVSVVGDDGCSFTIPGSAVHTIAANDGTAILKDAEYFCLVKVDESISLATKPHDHCNCNHEAHL